MNLVFKLRNRMHKLEIPSFVTQSSASIKTNSATEVALCIRATKINTLHLSKDRMMC